MICVYLDGAYDQIMKEMVDTTTVEDALVAVVMLRPPSLRLEKTKIKLNFKNICYLIKLDRHNRSETFYCRLLKHIAL